MLLSISSIFINNLYISPCIIIYTFNSYLIHISSTRIFLHTNINIKLSATWQSQRASRNVATWDADKCKHWEVRDPISPRVNTLSRGQFRHQLSDPQNTPALVSSLMCSHVYVEPFWNSNTSTYIHLYIQSHRVYSVLRFPPLKTLSLLSSPTTIFISL